MRARDEGPVAGGRANIIAKKQNTDNTSTCDWDFIVECLSISISSEWLKSFRVEAIKLLSINIYMP